MNNKSKSSPLILASVDDEKVIRRLIKKRIRPILKELKIPEDSIQEAKDLPSAEQILKTINFKLSAAFLDVNLGGPEDPNEDGFIIARMINEANSDVGIVFVTATPEKDIPKDIKYELYFDKMTIIMEDEATEKIKKFLVKKLDL